MFYRSRVSSTVGLCLLLAVLIAVIRPVRASDTFQDSYPPAQVTVESFFGDDALNTPTAQPYPFDSLGRDALTPVPIGIEGGGQAPLNGPGTAIAQTAPQDSGRGLLFLWVGFIATLLIFLTSVVGSIILFTRRNEV